MEVFAHEIGGSPNAYGHPAGKKGAIVKEFLYRNMDFVVLTIMFLFLVAIMLGLIS